MPRRPALPCGVWFCPVPMRILWPDNAFLQERIGAVYECSRSEVARRAVQLGIWEARKHPKTPVYSVAAFRAAWMDPSLPKGRIAQMFGLTRLQVYLHAKGMGLPSKKVGRLPIFDFGPDFSAMWSDGVLQADMARHFGCSLALIGIEADRRGLPRRSRVGPRNQITLAQWRELQLGRAMAVQAAETAAALELFEMVDLAMKRRAAA